MTDHFCTFRGLWELQRLPGRRRGPCGSKPHKRRLYLWLGPCDRLCNRAFPTYPPFSTVIKQNRSARSVPLVCTATVPGRDSVWMDAHRGGTSGSLTNLARGGNPVRGRSVAFRASGFSGCVDAATMVHGSGTVTDVDRIAEAG